MSGVGDFFKVFCFGGWGQMIHLGEGIAWERLGVGRIYSNKPWNELYQSQFSKISSTL